MTGVHCIIIILLMRVVQQYTSKSASMLVPSDAYGNFKYLMLGDLFASVFALGVLIFSGEFKQIDLMTVLLASFSGIMLVVTSFCGIYAIKSGSMALSSIFGTAGLIVPCVAGIFLFDEKMSIMQWVGIAMFLASSVLLIGATKKTNSKFSLKTVFLLIGSLVGNGITMLMQTVFSRTVENGSVSAFSFLSFSIPTVALLVVMGGCKIKAPEESKPRLPKKLMIVIIASSAALFVVNQFATMATGLVSPAILFTFINGGNTVIAAIMGAALFKEKLTVKSIIGITLGLLALITVKVFAPV